MEPFAGTTGVAAGPLAGVRIVDISTSYAGPTATMYLGDLGADVIKVERPSGGDDARSWGPPFVGDESAWFLSANRNKRSICLDLQTPLGLELLFRLLESADVFVESLNPVRLRELGLHPSEMRTRFPRLVYCSISGFGLDGPDHGLRGYDLIAQARSGLMSVTGPRGGSPERVSTALSDIVTGITAGFLIAAALYGRDQSGEGEVIDVSLLEADLALMAPRLAAFLAGEPEPQPSGGTDSVLAVYQRFETADEPVVLAIGNDKMWLRCCSVLGLDALGSDPAFASNAARRARRFEVLEAIAHVMPQRTAEEWVQAFAEAGVPCQRVQGLADVVVDPQVRARAIIGEYQHERAGSYQTLRAPWKLASTGRGPGAPAPVLGAHTLDVLNELGLVPEETEELLRKGVVWTAQTPIS